MSQLKNIPLTDDAIDRLESILGRFHGEWAMNLEMVDGFFTALICTPQITPPSAYLPEIWGGGEMAPDEEFESKQEFLDFLGLLMQHWNDVSNSLHNKVFLPILAKDSDGHVRGNDWAVGFLRGMDLYKADWSDLLNDDENGGGLVAIMALAHENHPDPELRPYKEPVNAELREKLILCLIAGARWNYEYFAPQRRMMASGHKPSPIRNTARIGRNEPCPCGSKRKYKRCCGNTTLI